MTQQFTVESGGWKVLRGVEVAPLLDWYQSLAGEGTNYRRYIDAAESPVCTDYTDKMPCDSRASTYLLNHARNGEVKCQTA
jgi:hypothetical protein